MSSYYVQIVRQGAKGMKEKLQDNPCPLNCSSSERKSRPMDIPIVEPGPEEIGRLSTRQVLKKQILEQNVSVQSCLL